MSIRWFSLLAVAAALSMPLVASAQPAEVPPPHQDFRPGADPMEQVFRQLDLTPAQESKIRAIRARHFKLIRDTLNTLHAKREEFFKFITDPQASQTAALAKQHEIGRLWATLGEERVKAWFESRQVLRPDQLQRLAKIKPPHRPERGWPPDQRRD